MQAGTARILVVGVGSLGRQLALGLAASPQVGAVTLASRNVTHGRTVAALAAACGTARVHFEPLDATDHAALERLLRRDHYDLIVQAGGLLAPWVLHSRSDRLARVVREAGFALRLCAQLPLIMTVMEAVRSVGYGGPIVNCSFPDLVNPVLARLGLAPSVGVGNVGMILYRVMAALRVQPTEAIGLPAPLPLVRVVAHHAHVDAAMNATPTPGEEPPQIYLGEEGRRADRLAYAGDPLPVGEDRNTLTLACALPVLRALLPGAAPLRTSVPAPDGLPGGYPVIIDQGAIQLDLPPGLAREAAIAFNWRSARADGVEALADDGTVFLTEPTRAALNGLAPELAEPLHPRDAMARFRLLHERLTR